MNRPSLVANLRSTAIGRIFLAVALLWCIPSATVLAQGPDADWRTRESEHFRWHYPAPTRAWVDDLAPRLEAIRQRVGEDVGFVPSQPVDVIVMDPLSRPNGSAWPMLGWPRMVLWTTPPPPDSVIGHYDDWATLLAIHEEVHLAHLLRPSRHPWRRRLGSIFPVGPVAQKSPRWVSEGYATLLEGELTGFGRPHSDFRAAVLRRWAQQGELPSYGRMAADGERWLGMSMAYLMGSAYLQWLQERQGPDALQHLWRRLSAHRQRSFGEAFMGVFGDTPQKLYNRFCAELTYRAMSLEEALGPDEGQGALWQDLSWTSGAPDVSADGRHVVIVLRSKDGPSKLVVWSTATDAAAEAKRRQRSEELLSRDPEDVAARHTGPPPRPPVYQRVSGYGVRPYTPRWLGDDAVLFVRFEPDNDGFLLPDLFRWQLDDTPQGTLQRLTFGAAVRDPDPAPGADWAVAVRHRYGRSELVQVDLTDGRVEPMDGGTMDTVVAFPRIAPDGRQLAYVRQRPGGWQLIVRPLNADRSLGPATVLATPPGARLTHPAWHGDSRHLYVSIGMDGLIDLYRLSIEGGKPVPLTRTQGAAMAPAPSPDERHLFYLSLEPDGLDLRRLDLDVLPQPQAFGHRLATWQAERRRSMVPALTPPTRPAPEVFESEPLSAERPYGLGKAELLPLVGGRWTADQEVLEGGLRIGDLLGRFEVLALAATSTEGFEGAALHAAWKGRPTRWRGHGFTLDEPLFGNTTRTAASKGRPALETYSGVELAARRQWRRRAAAGHFELGAMWGDIESAGFGDSQRRVLFANSTWRFSQRRADWSFGQVLDVAVELGRTGGDDWRRLDRRGAFRVGHRTLGGVELSWRRGDLLGDHHGFETFRLGGTRGSLPSPFALRQHIESPALPHALVSGDAFSTYRLDLKPGNGNWSIFYERHELTSGEPHKDTIALRGLELQWNRGPWPLLRLPGFHFSAGVAEILDTALQGEIEGWLTLSFRP